MSLPYAGLLEKAEWSPDDLLGTRWMFSHRGAPSSGMIWLQAEGRVGTYGHPDAAKWCIDHGRLALCTADGTITSRYPSVSMEPSGLLHLQGISTHDTALCLDQLPWDYERPLIDFLTRQVFAGHIEQFGWKVGENTYGCPLVYAQGPEKLLIGNYTSIGGHVTIVLATHRPDYVSTYPFVVHRKQWLGLLDGHTDHKGRGDVVIGNDVWLGHGSFIGSGVTIGDGAVIGAHSVVTKDVPPYAIVVGNPAHLVRYRFSEEVVADLLDIRWWDWPNERVEAFLPLILSDDITAFVRAVRSGNGLVTDTATQTAAHGGA